MQFHKFFDGFMKMHLKVIRVRKFLSFTFCQFFLLPFEVTRVYQGLLRVVKRYQGLIQVNSG